MTVCIKAIAELDDVIVSCVDTRISTATTSLDPITGSKFCSILGWTILSSGTTCDSESLVDTFQTLLLKAEDNEPPTVARCLESALRIELPRFMAARFLTPYGIDMPTFLSSARGSNGFTDERWNELSRQMLDYSNSYDVELLVSGWGQLQRTRPKHHSTAYIYSVSRNGVTPHSGDGFYACGSGADSAHSLLCFFNYQRHASIAEALYYVTVAKFMSEKTSGVGPNTLINVSARLAHDNSRGYLLQLEDMEHIRTIWENGGSPNMPEGAEKVMDCIAENFTRAMFRT